MDNEYVPEYNSVKDATEAVSGYNKYLIECCKNCKEFYKGYKWMYAEDYYKDHNNEDSNSSTEDD